jgi:hypothetical protein
MGSEPDPQEGVYPICCTSAFCGRMECSGCPNLPILTRFKEWRDRAQAEVRDPIWCPLVYTPTRKVEDPPR